MGVLLGGHQRPVSHQLLNFSQPRARCQEVAGTGVSERMRADTHAGPAQILQSELSEIPLYAPA